MNNKMERIAEGRIAGDLHMHTVCSDGSASVEYVLDYAEWIGLAYISVADHDTLAGSGRALKQARPGGVKVIPGAEISARDERTGQNVHMLCYYPIRISFRQRALAISLC